MEEWMGWLRTMATTPSMSDADTDSSLGSQIHFERYQCTASLLWDVSGDTSVILETQDDLASRQTRAMIRRRAGKSIQADRRAHRMVNGT